MEVHPLRHDYYLSYPLRQAVYLTPHDKYKNAVHPLGQIESDRSPTGPWDKIKLLVLTP